MIENILKLGWKNIWRNPTRSAVVMLAVILGTWAGIFFAGFFNGMMQDSLDNQIELSVGHIQVMHPDFEDLYNPRYDIQNAAEVLSFLGDKSYVKDLTPKSVASGLAQSSRSSFGVTINGLPFGEDTTQAINKYLQEGSLPDPGSRNPVLIGNKLADRLDVKIRSRMVLSFQNAEGELTGGAFRVSGTFDTFNDRFDEGEVFVLQKDLNRLVGLEGAVHNIRIDTEDLSMAESYAAELKEAFPGLQFKTWGDIAPDLRYAYDMMDLTLYIVMIIIIIGLIFSIINTMLMAVLERTRELGMLRAIGMNKARIFGMVMWETFCLTMVGAPLGMLLSYGTIRYFRAQGIDLSAFAEGLNSYGISTIIYPSLEWIYYLNIMLMIALAALLSALYPAWRSLKLKTVEAIRKFN